MKPLHNKDRPMLALIAVLATLASLPVESGTRPPPGREQEVRVTGKQRKPLYWKDPRLAQEVSIPGTSRLLVGLQRPDPEPEARAAGRRQEVRLIGSTLATGHEVTRAVRQKTDVTVLLQGNWMQEDLLLPRKGQPAREWMDALAETFGGRWLQMGRTWILAETQEEARLTLLSEEERALAGRRCATAYMRSFTPAQWQQMAQREGLAFSQLSPQQRALVLQSMRLYRYDPSVQYSVPGRQALAGAGVVLRLLGAGRQASVILRAPGPPGQDEWSVSLVFYENDGSLMWGVPPPW
jgi:hypothetical protein